MNNGELKIVWQIREEARREQHSMRWLDAAKLWRRVGDNAEAEACELLQEACDKGDRFRARVTELMEDATLKAYAQANEEIYGE